MLNPRGTATRYALQYYPWLNVQANYSYLSLVHRYLFQTWDGVQLISNKRSPPYYEFNDRSEKSIKKKNKK